MRHMDDQALISRAWLLRGRAPLIRERAVDARTCSVQAPTLHSVDDAGRTEARAGLVARGDGFVLVEVVGAVDIAARQELTDVLGRAVDSGVPAVIVDLDSVTLLAAAGFNCLQQTANLLAGRGGRLHLVCSTDGPAARSLRLLDPDGRWTPHADVPAAVATATGRA